MKHVLPRRTLLRGAGASIALPLLDAMQPAFAATPDHRGPTRVGFFYIPSGVSLQFWTPKGSGTNFEWSPILSPMAPFRRHTVIVSGLSNLIAESLAEGGGQHTRCPSAWLSGALAKKTEGADVECGTTADQIAAEALSGTTPLRSIDLALEPHLLVGNCDNGYSCIYKNTFSWRTPTTPVPMESNPRVVFERMCGDGGDARARLARLQKEHSVLDAIGSELKRLQRRLGAGDRRAVDEYVAAIRTVEQRIERVVAQGAEAVLDVGAKPVGTPDTYDEHARLMFDLLLLGYRADVSRAASYQIGREATPRTFPHIGVTEAHHVLSHHQDDPAKLATFAKVNTYHVSLFAEFVQKLQATPDGDGSLLDRVMLLFGSGMGNGNEHSPRELPTLLVGGANGRLKGGRHLVCQKDTPTSNLLVTLLRRLDIAVEHLGESTGEVSEL